MAPAAEAMATAGRNATKVFRTMTAMWRRWGVADQTSEVAKMTKTKLSVNSDRTKRG
jgi:hypothetical protein